MRNKKNKRKRTEDDAVELSLKKDIGDHYFVRWRYAERRKFLFISFPDRWRWIPYYREEGFTADRDPDDDRWWYWHGFHLGNAADVEEYRMLVDTARTVGDVFRYFHTAENAEAYRRHHAEHEKWLECVHESEDKLLHMDIYRERKKENDKR